MEDDPAGGGMRARFLGRRTTSCWSSLVDVVLDVSVLYWLEDGRWCLLSLVCLGSRFSCVVFSLSIMGHFLLFRELHLSRLARC